MVLNRQAGSQHAFADLGGPFRFELVAEHRADLGRLGVELLGHVLEPIAVARRRRLQISVEAMAGFVSLGFRPFNVSISECRKQPY